MPQTRTLLSVQTGQARRMRMAGRSLLTAMVKLPVQGPVPVGPLGLLGDEQADLSIHGGLGKAVYAYPSEHYPFWATVRSQANLP
jgi:MOSC domain-containing protein YiiM